MENCSQYRNASLYKTKYFEYGNTMYRADMSLFSYAISHYVMKHSLDCWRKCEFSDWALKDSFSKSGCTAIEGCRKMVSLALIIQKTFRVCAEDLSTISLPMN